MFKKLPFVIVAMLLGVAANAQNWVSFGKSEPAAPEFSVISSDNHSVVFDLNVYGMFVESKTGGSQTYQRLSLPECGVTGEIGTPELPVVFSQLIAVPECDNILYSVTITGSQTLTNYKVYPVPEVDDNGEEIFVLNTDAYGQNVVMPAADYQVSDNGYLRAQQYARLTLNPLRYNPATQTLTVATAMQVTLTFVNATTPVNAKLGIFANVATNSFLNFESTGMTAAINDMVFANDEETWENETPRGTVYEFDDRSYEIPTSPIDYLIIYSAAFKVNGKAHPEIQHLAEHRALYNGFNVLIMPADVLMSDAMGLPYEGNPYPGTGSNELYKNEQRIRSFIRLKYEMKDAPHTYDGHLGYVLLLGDVGTSVNDLPGSYDHPENNPYQQTNPDKWFPSDYFYSCVTKIGNVYDQVGDLYIGRICLPNNSSGVSKLKGQVDKIMYYEKEYIVHSGSTWQRNVVLATGVEYYRGTWKNYNQDLNSYYNQIAQNQIITHVNAYDNPNQYTQNIMTAINKGAGLVTIFNWGDRYQVYRINPSLMESTWAEDRKPSFGVFVVGSSGALDTSYNNSLARFLFNIGDKKGLVAAFAPARSASMAIHPLADMPKGYQCYIPRAIYTHLSTITGECTLEAKLNVNSEKYRYNLIGDPALNIVAHGFAITRPVTLETGTEISSWIKVYANVTIPDSATVFLKYNSQLSCYSGTVTVGNNATITGPKPMSPDPRLIIRGTSKLIGNTSSEITNIRVRIYGELVNNINFIGGVVQHSPVDAPVSTISSCTFTNTYVNIMSHHPSKIASHECYYSNCTFNTGSMDISSCSTDPPFKSTFVNSSFHQSPIYAEFHQFTLDNCVVNNRSDISILNNTVAKIKNCDFYRSGFYSTNISKYWGTGIIPIFYGYQQLVPFTKIIGCSFSNTRTFVGEYIDNGLGGDLIPIYSSASITLKKIKNFKVSGNTIINANAPAPKGVIDPGQPITPPYGEGIYITDAGNGSANNQVIQENKISQCETGLNVYNSKAQVYGNKIFDNVYGARLFNNSQTTFSGFDGNLGFCDFQIIRDNISYEIYASQNSFPNPFKYNQVIDEDNKGNLQNDPLFYYDTQEPPGPRCVGITCNYWGVNFNHNEDIYPPNRFCTSPIWNPQTGVCALSGRTLYEDGLDYFENNEYESAKSAFMELIETYPEDELAIAALHQLFALEQFLSEDYSALHDYYAAFTPADTTLFDVADFLATRCNVIDQNWQPAIDWYENRIAEPPSYPDSVFAVIDLGDIHLMMESDSLKAGRVLRFPHLIPKSKREYEENKTELLATLPKIEQPKHPLAETGKTGVLSQNIPNPANGSTTVVYDVIKEGQVELRMYNQLGQLLQTLPQGTKKEGTYRIELSLAGLPAGMYHYILFINGEKADAKKLIVQ